jgi:hypothetical protein
MRSYNYLKGGLAAVALLGMTLGATAAHADIVNGSFESGLSGWSGIGSVNTSVLFTGGVDSSGLGLHTAQDGLWMANLNGDGVNRNQLESFLGLSNGNLDTLTPHTVTNGSALKQTFMASAGDSISFSWNFIANDFYTPGSGLNDFAFFSLVPNNPSSGVLSSIQNVGNFGFSGWQTFTYTFTETNEYTLGFGVVNTRDVFFNSTLLIDNVQFHSTAPPAAVPEPGAYATAGIFGGALLAGILVGRRRKKDDAERLIDGADESVLAV